MLRRLPARRLAVLALATLVAAACTPALDWRKLHSDAGYTLDLPAKPTLDAREIAIGGAPMTMRMQAAHLSGAVFAVGTVILPDARPATQQAALEVLRGALSRNLRAPAARRDVAVARGARRACLSGRRDRRRAAAGRCARSVFRLVQARLKDACASPNMSTN
ncbi:MAG: hypothetical protein GAK41_00747 [Burkholderia gladioli]|nr:MAG: hypothetical protein GAK41_00747 [Burkholderia gladioli]